LTRLSYGVPNEAIVEALRPYGKVLHIKMDSYQGVYVGVRNVLMEITVPIPSSIKVADHYCNIFYPGQIATCFACRQAGHTRANCPGNRAPGAVVPPVEHVIDPIQVAAVVDNLVGEIASQVPTPPGVAEQDPTPVNVAASTSYADVVNSPAAEPDPSDKVIPETDPLPVSDSPVIAVSGQSDEIQLDPLASLLLASQVDAVNDREHPTAMDDNADVHADNVGDHSEEHDNKEDTMDDDDDEEEEDEYADAPAYTENEDKDTGFSADVEENGSTSLATKRGWSDSSESSDDSASHPRKREKAIGAVNSALEPEPVLCAADIPLPDDDDDEFSPDLFSNTPKDPVTVDDKESPFPAKDTMDSPSTPIPPNRPRVGAASQSSSSGLSQFLSKRTRPEPVYGSGLRSKSKGKPSR
jgi:hypothetical protein